MRAATDPFRVAAVGDLHCREDHRGRFRELVRQANAEAHVLLLCGDLTDRGLPREAATLAEELSALRIPCLGVLGNHDVEAGHAEEVEEILGRVGVRLLAGDHSVVDKVLGVAGVKGFGGGYGNATLQAFGEGTVRAYVQEAVNESLRLEAALGQLDTPRKVVITHYAPIPGTTEGENPEIRPFLGTSRLMGPIDRYGAQVVFHGHAHHGSPEGRTDKGVPVFNVAYPLLRRQDPPLRFRLYEL